MIPHALTHWRCAGKPNYVVAGFMRSGTTAMMQALEAGGMVADRAPESDPLHDRYELDATQRSYGWYSERDGEIATVDLPLGQRYPIRHRGHVIKMLVGSARYAEPSPHGYVVVYMRRATEAIVPSSKREFGYPYSAEAVERNVTEDHERWLTRAADPSENVRVIDVWYDSLIEHPLEVFDALRDFGFPIDPRKAAAAIDPEQRHFLPTEPVAWVAS